MNAADTAWVLVSAGLVMFMTPGLALFYSGMIRARSMLNTIALTIACLGVVGVVWVAFGYSLAFGPDAGGGLIGTLSQGGLHNMASQLTGPAGHRIPVFALASFQLMFAIITVALLAGAVAERTRFWPWLVFVALWVTVVYLPLAHWVFDPDGWFVARLHLLDFAGGTAVEANSGAASLALAFVVGKRLGWPREQPRPHNLPLVLLGAGILWFGWFGFNAGSALAADGLAATAFLNTMLAGGTGLIGWLVVEQRRDGKPTTLGAAAGAVAGLVGITPACGFVEPLGGAAIGFAAGVIAALAIRLKYRHGFDDSLDVVAVHGIGGLTGLLATGLLATTAVNAAGANGLLYGGGFTQLGRQALAALVTIAYSGLLTLAIAALVQKTIGLRATREAELAGLDEAEHAETAYDNGRFATHHTGLATAARTQGGHDAAAKPPAALPRHRQNESCRAWSAAGLPAGSRCGVPHPRRRCSQPRPVTPGWRPPPSGAAIRPGRRRRPARTRA